ncbi:TPA: DUF3102 domain-containing protein [Streptococcus pyogenes]|nr:DUF3102 domain-containing protein [Streptococcus pyogenes]HER0889977.1 DUF3102 domain-containing protein [Streptococcus pyogenes]HER0893344.1 DUF3102 domain-containing protein [Streptococcus pyogenes]
MNEITLSNNLAQIELEISHHKQIAGQSIWEIGRRLKHVKENDLTHGNFMSWYQSIGLDKDFVSKAMTISNELPNFETLRNLGTTALHLIATLPDDQKQEQLERIENGDNPTVRELQEIKRENNRLKAENARLEQQKENLAEQALSAKIVEKEVIKEVYPADYNEAISLSQELMESNKAHTERNAFLEKQLQDLYAQRAEVDEKSAKYDELTEAIRQSQGQLNETQAKIGSYKKLLSFLRKGNEMLLHMGGLIYIDEERIINSDTQMRREFEQLQQSVNRLSEDLNKMLNLNNEILEGEIL